jgi:hypothetical protein
MPLSMIPTTRLPVSDALQSLVMSYAKIGFHKLGNLNNTVVSIDSPIKKHVFTYRIITLQDTTINKLVNNFNEHKITNGDSG